MKKEEYTEMELHEIIRKAFWFKVKNFWRMPGILIGHKVANRSPHSKVRNMSTITTCFSLTTGKWVYLIYNYPMSIIHRPLDGLCKWATEKYCIKAISPGKWKKAFVQNSFIPIIPVDIKNVVAMPYIENENLYDILIGKIGNYTFPEKEEMLIMATEVINKMHSRNIVWGELIVHNMIRSDEGNIIICDTETVYYRGSLTEQKASDWLDFICSVCGSISQLHPDKTETESLVQIIMSRISEDAVKAALKEICKKKRTWLHRLFFLYTLGRLKCPPKLYDHIKDMIVLS